MVSQSGKLSIVLHQLAALVHILIEQIIRLHGRNRYTIDNLRSYIDYWLQSTSLYVTYQSNGSSTIFRLLLWEEMIEKSMYGNHKAWQRWSNFSLGIKAMKHLPNIKTHHVHTWNVGMGVWVSQTSLNIFCKDNCKNLHLHCESCPSVGWFGSISFPQFLFAHSHGSLQNPDLH